MKLTVINRTKWPTPAIKILGKWICWHAGITWNYQITLGNSRRGWYGRGGSCSQTTHLDRRYRLKFPYKIEDSRITNGPTYLVNSRLELLVFLLAHEACHANGGKPSEYRNKETRRVDRQSMEYDCNLFGMETVKALREEWKELRPRIMAAMRRERDQKNRKRDPDARLLKNLERARDTLVKWERKLKLASTKVKKYRQKIRYYEGRTAARSGQ